jgi:hypothetical protein
MDFLFDEFLSEAIPEEDFQISYLQRFKNETRPLDEALFEAPDPSRTGSL